MAHVEKRTHTAKDGKKSVYWRARYEDPSGNRRSKNFERKLDADRFLIEAQADVLRGEYVDPAAGRRLFADLAGHWQAQQVHRPSTTAQVQSHMKNNILPFFGDRPVAQVRPSEIQAWVKDRSQHLAPSTVECVYRYLSAVFRLAVEDGLLVRTPCRGIKLPKVERPRVVPMSTEQVQALIQAMPERYRALVVLAAGTGLRQGEAFGLTRTHVDFLRRHLRVEQQLITLPTKGPHLAPPKTGASRRTIPVPNVVIDALAAHMAVFDPGPFGLIFTNHRDDPINRTRFSEIWRPAARAAGLADEVTFHDLRHFYASLLIRHGESVKVVQARLGHASATETLDTYSHLWPRLRGPHPSGRGRRARCGCQPQYSPNGGWGGVNMLVRRVVVASRPVRRRQSGVLR